MATEKNIMTLEEQLEEAYTEIIEATSLVNVLRSTGGGCIELSETDLSMCCSVIGQILLSAGRTVETGNCQGNCRLGE